MGKLCDMEGVREYGDGEKVELWRDDKTGRLVIRAYNEARYNGTEVDLCDLLRWLLADPGANVALASDSDVIELAAKLSTRNGS